MIVGSQPNLGYFPNPDEAFTMSAEADIHPMHAPGPMLSDRIESAIGECRRST